jgi:hypothetical protein
VRSSGGILAWGLLFAAALAAEDGGCMDEAARPLGPVEVVEEQGGVVGTTATAWRVSPDGRLRVERRLNDRVTRRHQRTLSDAERASLAGPLAAAAGALAELPAEPGRPARANPRRLHVRVGSREAHVLLEDAAEGPAATLAALADALRALPASAPAASTEGQRRPPRGRR